MPETESPTRDVDESVREELERFEAEMRRQKRRAERRRKVMEARSRIMVTLMGLSRYEPRYEGVRALLEDQWRSARSASD